MLYKRYFVCGTLLAVVGIGCTIYGYVVYTSVPRAGWVMMEGKGGYLSPQEHIDILRRLEQAGYDVAEYRERAERDATQQRVERNVKVGVSAAACLACLLPGIILLVHGLALKPRIDAESM